MKETKKLCQEIRTLVKQRQFESTFTKQESHKTSQEVKDWYLELETILDDMEELS